MKYYIIHHIVILDQFVKWIKWNGRRNGGDAPNFDIYIGFYEDNDSGYESNGEEEEEED